LRGSLTYFDKKRNSVVGIKPSATVIWIRPRGLHISQDGVLGDRTSASLFDVASIAFRVDASELKHPLAFYIPKSESAEEALWWRDVFQAIAEMRSWPRNYIKCMALVESHPLAFQMEEFLFNLRDHIVGLNLGRWDYMASLIHFNLEDPDWVMPDRNTIPHDVTFFQNLRELMPEICHKRGVLAIGGMTALYPSREDVELNARALAVLAKDKKNEADCLMDGAWTSRPESDCSRAVFLPQPNPSPSGIGGAVSQSPSEARRRRSTNTRRYASGHSNGDSLSQWCAERSRREPARRIHGGSGDRPYLSPDDRTTHATQ
jgi:malate synthase